mmetsp:Transcript_21966/g.32644  ORF Transcript_21966/g.32644 Transcript_21966/m.32644 type:complete len:86 (+) Transcript_21966:281-538(+)
MIYLTQYTNENIALCKKKFGVTKYVIAEQHFDLKGNRNFVKSSLKKHAIFKYTICFDDSSKIVQYTKQQFISVNSYKNCKKITGW